MKLNHQSLAEKTADALLHKIHLENYRVGAKLPNEIELAEEFEVSRTTIRQAISILREKGYLNTIKGSGTFISDFTEKQEYLNDPLGLSLSYDKTKMIHDLLELRILIEPRCALLAAQNASSKDIENLMTICDEFDQLVENKESYVTKDMEFHQMIANSSGNLVLHNLIPYIHQMHVLTNEEYLNLHAKSVAKEHRKIAEAIRDRNGSEAFDAMYYHLVVLTNSC